MWKKLWKDFKDYTRKRQLCKSGDGAKKGLDPKFVQLMEKMNGFEAEVPDLFSNTLSSLKRNNPAAKIESKSIWESNGEKPLNINKKRKIPPTSAKYNEREDKKNQLMDMMLEFKGAIGDLTKQSKNLIASKMQPSQPPLPAEDQAKVDLRTSLSTIVDKYLVHLDAKNRANCFQEMLQVFE